MKRLKSISFTEIDLVSFPEKEYLMAVEEEFGASIEVMKGTGLECADFIIKEFELEEDEDYKRWNITETMEHAESLNGDGYPYITIYSL